MSLLQYQISSRRCSRDNLNHKMVRIKNGPKWRKTLRIDFDGEGEVKAGDIVTDGTVEILNPDLHIATVSKEENFIYMEIVLRRHGKRI